MSYGRFTKVAEIAYGREMARLQYAGSYGMQKHSEFSDYAVPMGAAAGVGALGGLALGPTGAGSALRSVPGSYKLLRNAEFGNLGRWEALKGALSPKRLAGNAELSRLTQAGGKLRRFGAPAAIGAGGLAALTGAGMGIRHLLSD